MKQDDPIQLQHCGSLGIKAMGTEDLGGTAVDVSWNHNGGEVGSVLEMGEDEDALHRPQEACRVGDS